MTVQDQNDRSSRCRPIWCGAPDEDGLQVARPPVRDASERALLAGTAGRLAWQDGVACVALSRHEDGLVMTITFRDAFHRAEWLASAAQGAPPANSPSEQPRSSALPPFWKRWSVSMLAVYPALILLVYLIRPFTEGLPAPVSLLIVALLLTGLSTRWIVPFLNRRLGKWLAAR